MVLTVIAKIFNVISQKPQIKTHNYDYVSLDEALSE